MKEYSSHKLFIGPMAFYIGFTQDFTDPTVEQREDGDVLVAISPTVYGRLIEGNIQQIEAAEVSDEDKLVYRSLHNKYAQDGVPVEYPVTVYYREPQESVNDTVH